MPIINCTIRYVNGIRVMLKQRLATIFNQDLQAAERNRLSSDASQ